MPAQNPETRGFEGHSARKRVDELTENFLKCTLKIIMERLGADRGCLFFFDTASGRLVSSGNGRSCRGSVNHVWPSPDPVISFPLSAENSFLGLFNIGFSGKKFVFTRDDVRFASALCNYACRIVEDQARFVRMREDIEKAVLEKNIMAKYSTVGRLAPDIAGRINSPLDGVKLYASLMPETDTCDVKRSEYLTQIKTGLERISDATSSLFSFKSEEPRAGARGLCPELNKMIDEILDYQMGTYEGVIRIERDYAPGISFDSGPGLRVVIANLVKNALEAMPSEGKLSIATINNGSGVKIVIKDTGTGIPASDREKIFDPFFTTKTIGRGAGIGLSICKDIVAGYGGRIIVDSVPGKGSCFTVILPKNVVPGKKGDDHGQRAGSDSRR